MGCGWVDVCGGLAGGWMDGWAACVRGCCSDVRWAVCRALPDCVWWLGEGEGCVSVVPVVCGDWCVW